MANPTPQALIIRDAKGALQSSAVTPALDANGNPVVTTVTVAGGSAPASVKLTALKAIVSDPDVLTQVTSAAASLVTIAAGSGGSGATASNQTTEITAMQAIQVNTSRIPAQGAATRSGSTPVTIASDQPAIAVTGSFTTTPSGTQTVAGTVAVSALPALPAGANNVGGFTLRDGVQPSNIATVSAFHSADNQNPGGTAYGLLTGGVAQIVNPAGFLNRQRETGFDNIPGSGVATGTAQLAGAPMSTVTSGAISASASPQNVTLAAVTFTNRGVTTTYQTGTTLLVEPGANQEYVYVNSVAGLVINAAFAKAHASGVAVMAFSYSQSRDATIPDGSSPAGINASCAYLFNAGNGTVEFERSFSGELMGARGTGAAIAAEYEDTSGGPPLASGVSSGLRLMPGQSLMGVGSGSAAITSTTSGNSSIVLASAAATNMLPPGHAVQLTGGGGAETVFTSLTWVPGSSATVPLQSPVVRNGQVTAAWSQFAANGPGLNGFLPHGIAIEEEAVYDPVSGQFYIERAATSDGMAATNIVAESGVLWNGATFDRMRAVSGDGMGTTGIEASADMLWNGSGYDRPRGVSGDGMAATGIPAEAGMLWNGASYDRWYGSVSGGARVSVVSLPSLPAGANALGSVSISNLPATQTVAGAVAVSALPSLPAGSAAIGSVSVSNLPGQFTVVDPDISTVTTASTAVTAFTAGHVAKGGWIKNPSAAVGPLFIRLTGAAGTSESGGTCSVGAGQSFVIPPMSGTVSVNAADAGHLFCGAGYQ